MCHFRAEGPDFDVDGFLSQTGLEVDGVWRRGELNYLNQPHDTSGLMLDVSDAPFDDVDGQAADALAFLEDHEATLRRLNALPNTVDAFVHFGAFYREHTVSVTATFPPRLVRAAGRLGVRVLISWYPASGDDDDAGEPTN